MNQQSKSPKPYVLVTGATGMVGSRILVNLLSAQVPVVVLTRGKTTKFSRKTLSAEQRIEAVLQIFEQRFDRRYKRPVVLDGDLNSENLGLSTADLEWLANHCGQVIHSAASLSFRSAADDPHNEPFRTNRDGTENLASLLQSLGVVKFHYISTAYVCGTRSGLVSEDDQDCGQAFSNDYELSKLQAEKYLRGCFRGERLTVYRPSIVIDSSAICADWQDRTVSTAHGIYSALASKFGLPKRGEWFASLGLDNSQLKNFVEAQWVAMAMVEIFKDPSLHGGTYHLTSKSGTSVRDIEDAFYQVALESDERKQSEDTAGDSAGRTSNPRGSGHSLVSAQQQMMIESIAAPYISTFLPYFRDDPVFGRSNIESAITRLSLPEPPTIDAAKLTKMFQAVKNLNPGQLEVLSPQTPESVLTLGGDAMAACRGESPWGIIVSGPGGGDFRVCLGDARAYRGGEVCERRLYLAAEDWQRLLLGQVNLNVLMQSGRAVIECDGLEESRMNAYQLEADRHTASARLVREAGAIVDHVRKSLLREKTGDDERDLRVSAHASHPNGRESAK